MGVESDDEFRDFMRSRWSAMVRLAYTLTGDQGHAEDIAQAAFSSAYSAWGRVRRASDPDAYVRAIVIHENSKRFRKQRVREDLRAAVPERGTGADDSLADRAALRDALSRLGPPARGDRPALLAGHVRSRHRSGAQLLGRHGQEPDLPGAGHPAQAR